MVAAVNFYEVMADGFHTSLTKTQITELVHAGRLTRSDPCKLVEKREWRTIDELFPLLKYDSSIHSYYEASEAHSSFSRNPTILLLILTLATTALVLIGYFTLGSGSRSTTSLPIVRSPQSGNSSSSIMTGSKLDGGTSQARLTGGTIRGVAPLSQPLQPDIHGSWQRARAAEERSDVERRQREQLQRDQAALADQARLNANRQRQEAERAAGTDYHVPLNEDYQLSMAGSWVRVRIHDNDVTSFDAWIDGVHYREVRKEKGISHSRTDETFLYSNGRASLYYVWEISGRLNHCLLRVREN